LKSLFVEFGLILKHKLVLRGKVPELFREDESSVELGDVLLALLQSLQLMLVEVMERRLRPSRLTYIFWNLILTAVLLFHQHFLRHS
jgi:hypothetical protein